MAIYTLHLPAGIPARSSQAQSELVTVRDGFSWLAFLFTLPWLLWHRLWAATLGYLVAVFLVGLIATKLGIDDESLLSFAVLAISFFFGLEAGSLRADKLSSRGYVQVASEFADRREDAELKFFAAAGQL